MRTQLWAALFLAAVPAFADGQGYLFFGPGNARALHLGGGGEGLVYKGLGLGGELGYAFPRGAFGGGIGLLSANASYHFNVRSHWKIHPFVTGGYTLAVRSGTANLVNLGGGLTYWMSDRVGLRVEYREYVPTAWRGDLREVRFGLALR
jgi:hypothetical protein